MSYRQFVLISLSLSGAILGTVITGCGSGYRLKPAATATVLPNNQGAAVGEAQGVRTVADAGAWKGNPGDLDEHITPIQVTIVNQSGQPLRIRYNEFKLVTNSGFQATAIPPFRIEGSIAELRPVPGYAWDRFSVAPWYSGWYGRRYGVWGSPWAFDSGYYGPMYQIWRTPLPTEDMLEKAIPEGALENNGRITGYFYFQRVPSDESRRIEFVADLVNAETGREFGEIRIPFVIG